MATFVKLGFLGSMTVNHPQTIGKCVKRLKFLHRKLKVEPALSSKYHNIIQEQERNGIIEMADEALGDDSNNKGIHYLLHHAVVRKDREITKVRVVYDGTAKTSKNELLLSGCLEVGLNYIPHIFDLLTKFRYNAIGLLQLT